MGCNLLLQAWDGGQPKHKGCKQAIWNWKIKGNVVPRRGAFPGKNQKHVSNTSTSLFINYAVSFNQNPSGTSVVPCWSGLVFTQPQTASRKTLVQSKLLDVLHRLKSALVNQLIQTTRSRQLSESVCVCTETKFEIDAFWRCTQQVVNYKRATSEAILRWDTY